MNSTKVQILVADFVPLKNKGEEAIVRGIEDLIRGNREAKVAVFDNVDKVVEHDGLTVFPWRWIYSLQGQRPKPPRTERLVRNGLTALGMRLGYYGRMAHLLPGGPRRYKALQDFFDQADYVVAGHNGIFCTESCGVIHLARKAGKRTGILGSGVGISRTGKVYQKWLYRRAMQESDFCIFRERHSHASMKSVAADPERLMLAPDPAFAMQPIAAAEAKAILERYAPLAQARRAGKPIVGMTVLEKGVVFQHFRSDLQGEAKKVAHAAYLGRIVKRLIGAGDAFVVFLPHSIEVGFNDVEAAQRVVRAMGDKAAHCMILDLDLNARTLKGIIGQLDLLIGERTHSLIGSVSMGVPSVALTTTPDYRTHGIIGDMCGCAEHLINIDQVSAELASLKCLEALINRKHLAAKLRTTRIHLERQLETMRSVVVGRPDDEVRRSAHACPTLVEPASIL
jgi:polysaccharide pyruvyl transferase WcaK-like protein